MLNDILFRTFAVVIMYNIGYQKLNSNDYEQKLFVDVVVHLMFNACDGTGLLLLLQGGKNAFNPK